MYNQYNDLPVVYKGEVNTNKPKRLYHEPYMHVMV